MPNPFNPITVSKLKSAAKFLAQGAKLAQDFSFFSD